MAPQSPLSSGVMFRCAMSNQSADTFIQHFENQLHIIRLVDSVLHRKILYAATLDPFSRACFGKNGTHRDRVSKLIKNLSGWDSHSRVSLPQLKLNLEQSCEISNGNFYAEVCSALGGWPEGQLVRLHKSPEIDSLKLLAVNEKQIELVARCQYVNLFYNYRNALIHEFREPGYGLEFSNDGSEPYYHGMIDSPWQLVYPVAFFDSLVESVLNNLSEFFEVNSIEPHDQFEFGSTWLSR